MERVLFLHPSDPNCPLSGSTVNVGEPNCHICGVELVLNGNSISTDGYHKEVTNGLSPQDAVSPSAQLKTISSF